MHDLMHRPMHDQRRGVARHPQTCTVIYQALGGSFRATVGLTCIGVWDAHPAPDQAKIPRATTTKIVARSSRAGWISVGYHELTTATP